MDSVLCVVGVCVLNCCIISRRVDQFPVGLVEHVEDGGGGLGV